ncbi:MAG: S8 family peptidase [Candidatus Bathyarchaeia archaeon]
MSSVRVIVGFKPMPCIPPGSQAGFDFTELIREYGGEVLDVFDSVQAVSALVPTSMLNGLRSRPEVAFIEEDEVGASYGETVGWGLTAVHAPAAWNYSTGHAVRIAVLDTGIDYDHPDLNRAVKGGVDFTGSEHGYRDVQGHGTHVAGIIAASRNDFGTVGVAYDAELYAVKVLRDSDGWGYYSWWIKGIEWAVENKMQVISMSLGGTTDSQALKRAVDLAYSRGLLIVAAAGNAAEGSDGILYPARYESVIAVGAVDSSNHAAGFSRKGPELELTAPGVSVYTTAPGSSYAYSSGTSTATPFVAATVALLWAANGNLTNTQIRGILDSTALDLGPQGRDPSYGYGLLDSFNALNAARASAGNTYSAQTTVDDEEAARSDRAVSVVPGVSLIGNSTVVVAQGGYSTLSLTVTGAPRGNMGLLVSVSGLPSGVSAKLSGTPCTQAAESATLKVVLVAGLDVPSGEYTASLMGIGEGQNSTLPIKGVVRENPLARSLLSSFFQWMDVISKPLMPLGAA